MSAGSRTRRAGVALVVNAGSRTFKASVVDPARRRTLATAAVDRPDGATDADDRRLVGQLVDRLGSPVRSATAVGHRVVHGGEAFRAPVLIDDAVVGRLAAISGLAPLHNPVALAAIRAARDALPGLAHVACFDTAFHATLPETAWRYPVPDAWLDTWGVRRYGFHGLSVEWATRRAGERLGRPLRGLDLVVAHLGGGCSVSAVRGGRSVWTSMGLTPLEGLMMTTRAGSIDPGAIIAVLRRGATVDEVEAALDRRSGLVALAGTADLAMVLERARDGDARARLAVTMFVDRAAAEIAAAATRLRRLDAIVFTGGIGEHAPSVRRAIVARVGGSAGSAARPAVLVVEAREDLVIGEAALRVAARADR